MRRNKWIAVLLCLTMMVGMIYAYPGQVEADEETSPPVQSSVPDTTSQNIDQGKSITNDQVEGSNSAQSTGGTNIEESTVSNYVYSNEENPEPLITVGRFQVLGMVGEVVYHEETISNIEQNAPMGLRAASASSGSSSLLNLLESGASSAQAPDKGKIQGFVNGLAGKRPGTQSDKPFLADRSGVSESIDPQSGTLYLSYDDLTLPGRDGFDLSLGRYFTTSQTILGQKKVILNLETAELETAAGTTVYYAILAYNDNTTKTYGPFADSRSANLTAAGYADDTGCTGYLVAAGTAQGGEYCHTMSVTSYLDADNVNYLRSRYDLGTGWSFAFPSVEKQTDSDNDKTYLTYFDGDGAAFEVQSLDNPVYGNLKDYQGKDVIFGEVGKLNKSYSNGQLTAAYVFIDCDQNETYFADDGRLLGMKDRCGNEIKFDHVSRTINGTAYPFISHIYDSVGRTVTFDYSNENEISVTVTDPNNAAKNLTLKYKKDYITYTYTHRDSASGSLTQQTRQEPRLVEYVDPMNNSDKFAYTAANVKFDYGSQSFASGDNKPQDTMLLLNKVEYPESNTYYSYASKLRLLMSPSGRSEDYVVSERYDTNKTSLGESAHMNRETFIINGDHTNQYYFQPTKTYINTIKNYASDKQTEGLTTQNTFDQTGRQLESCATDGVKTTYVYYKDFDSRFKMKPQTITTVDYDTDSSETATSNTTRAFNDWGGVTQETKDGLNTIYSYTDTNNKFMVTQKQYTQSSSVTLSETWTYNGDGRILTHTDSKGESTTYSYTPDSTNSHKITAMTVTKPLETGQARSTITYGSNSCYAYPTEISTTYTDENGSTQNSIISKSYDMLHGLAVSSTDPLNQSTYYTYDNLGRVISIRLPDADNSEVYQKVSYTPGVTSTLFNDTNTGLLTTRIESYILYKDKTTGAEHQYQKVQDYFNAYGQLVLKCRYDETTSAWQQVIQNYYDNEGRCIKATDALNNTDQCQYDNWDNPVKYIDSLAHINVTEYYPGARKQVNYFIASEGADPEHKVETDYDSFGRVIKEIALPSGNNETYQYDLMGNLTSYTDPEQKTTTLAYDQLNRLIKVTDAKNQATDYTYSKLGLLNTITQSDAGNTFITSYDYNEMGLLKQRKDPGNAIDTMVHNAKGQVTGFTDPGNHSFTYTYDSWGRMITQGCIGDKTYTYGYDNKPWGAVSITSSNGDSINYAYDQYGRLTSQTENGLAQSAAYTYDQLDRITSITDPNNNQTGYQYTGTRLNQVTFGSSSVSYEYYADGQNKSVTLTGGVKTSREYDEFNRLTKVVNAKDSTVLSQFEYTYDKDGNMKTSRSTYGDTTYNETYDYDELNRLIKTTRDDGTTSEYQYDARGNRSTVTGTVPDLPTDISFTYNPWNQLTSTTVGTSQTTYQYNPQGLRSKKITAGGTTRYVYDTSGRIIAEVDGSNNLIASYIWGPGELIAKKDVAGNLYYYLYNGHGDVVQIVDTSGNIVNRYRYDEWGNILNQSETVQNEFKYAGQSYDTENGLYYLRARYYDPRAGRFVSKDSVEGEITNPLSLNLYTYVQNNPINYVDPSGHVSIGLRDTVSQWGGSISWNDKTRTATATVNGKTQTFNINNYTVSNGRIMIDSSQFAKTFGVSQFGVEARRTINQTTTYLSSDKAKTAYVQTAVAVGTSHLGQIIQGGRAAYTGIKAARAATIATPYESVVAQGTTQAALRVRQEVANGGKVFRAGEFDRSGASEGQFWAPESPFNPGYAGRYGVDFSKVDFVIGGSVKEGAPFVTRAAPGLGANQGGAIEVVTNPYSVMLDFFHMP